MLKCTCHEAHFDLIAFVQFIQAGIARTATHTQAKVKRKERLKASSPQRLIFSRRRAFIPAAVPSFTLPKLTQCKTSCPKVCETKKLDEKPNAADE